MVATMVHVHVKPEHIQDFIEACRLNHAASINEQGNLRFDILQNATEPDKFVLYEAYQTEESALAHKQTAHYALWRDTVADWMASPRNGLKHNILYPKAT